MSILDGTADGAIAEAKASRGAKAFETRRTFAIISHPDAGKTTLTERLLLRSGAIRLAGQVKAKGQRAHARSDWMEIERKRGISVTSSVMTFERDGLTFNLLDTPGHSDFSEDTYRTLTAVDSAVMVIDAARGIESQTLKLFEVCRLRNIPIITFINKVDREGLDPLELLDDIASRLALDVTPLTWPIGMGVGFRGCLDLVAGRSVLPNGEPGPLTFNDVDALAEDPALLADESFRWSMESLQIARSSLPAFDLASYREGHLTPVLFGSALKDVCVAELLHTVGAWAPCPQPQPAQPEAIDPAEEEVTGFVFKVQANMDPSHRDRVAFARICSGRFRRGMKLLNVAKGRELTISNPMFFFAQDRETVDEAVAGDVVGIPNHGTLSVGDTLTEGSARRVTGIPNFAPEIIRRVRSVDAMKAKRLAKALNDLAEEGVTQVFRPMTGADWLVGVVGPLQIEVLAARIESEYGLPIAFEPAGYDTARWISADDPIELKRFTTDNRGVLAVDRAEAPVFLARSAWELQRLEKLWPSIRFSATRERA
jgi:peptide chain release factor 3